MDPYEVWEGFEQKLFRLSRRRLIYQVLMFTMGGVMAFAILFIEVYSVAGWVSLASGLLMSIGSFGWSYYNHRIHNLLQARFNGQQYYNYHPNKFQ